MAEEPAFSLSIEEQGPLPAPQTPPASPSRPPRLSSLVEEPVSPLEEYKTVEPLVSAPLKAGSAYFLINRRWYTEWLQWVGHPCVQSPKLRPLPDPLLPDGAELEAEGSSAKRTRTHSWTKDRPGQIDNSELLEEGSTAIRRGLLERADYELVPEDAWNLLYSWYGGGPPVKRRAIELPSGGVQVELHGLTLKVYKSSETAGTPLEVTESKLMAVKELKASLCQEMGLDPEKTRIWDYFNNRNYALLEKNADKSLESCRIFDQNPILLEEQNADGSWPYQEGADDSGDLGAGSVGGLGEASAYSSADVPSVGEPLQRGAVGLQNLGNTCFMNSSIQCLSNIPPLREFFITEEYRDSLNRTAYKTKGKLAESFAQLLALMWREDTTRVAPRNFKYQVGQFAEQFSGYGQQDSMELIEYVLDGLKEDCNLVQGQKPYIEVKEADGRPDEEVAAEALETYRKRSNSRVDDLFVGLFKSVRARPMPRKARASGSAAAAEPAEAEPQKAGSGKAGEGERTFSAPSGKHYVIVQDSFPDEPPPELREDVVTASEGDLLELLMTHLDVGYGRRFKARDGAVNEGVFRLEWVKGVRLVLVDGKRQPVEVEIDAPEFGFQQPKGGDTASKLRIKRYRKKIEDAAQVWARAGEAGTLAKQEAAASKAAAALEKADAAEKARKLKAQQLKQQREQQRQQEEEKRQQEELQRQQEELQRQQEELQRQQEELQRQQEELQRQQEELQRQQEAQQQEQKLQEDEPQGSEDLHIQSQQLQRHPEEQQQRPATDAQSALGREVAPLGVPALPEATSDARSEGEAGCLSPSSCEGPGSCSGSSPEAGSPERPRRRTLVSQRAWDSQWEKQAAQLEAVLSASSSGVEDAEGGYHKRPSLQKKITTRKFTRTLLLAKRSGELQAIAEEWEKAHSEMASKASDLSALKEKVKRGLVGARRADDVERIIEEMASEAERKAAEVKELKERVFRAMIAMKRSKNLERTASDMDDAQKELEMRALQLKNLMKRAWKGMVESKRHGELERIADEMSEDFQTKADSLKNKVRKGLLRAYRAGELQEIRHELDEIADTVPLQEGPGEPKFGGAEEEVPTTHARKRWAEYSSDSDAVGGEQRATPGTLQPERRRVSSPAEADVSGSDADSSAGPGSPCRL